MHYIARNKRFGTTLQFRTAKLKNRGVWTLPQAKKWPTYKGAELSLSVMGIGWVTKNLELKHNLNECEDHFSKMIDLELI